jgi:NhaP-type Na+/H+ or K+/H+ antiporter
VLNVFYFDPITQSALLEVLTEIALLISLFSAGIKMPVPFKWPRWDAPLRLAWLSMTMTVGLVALFGYYVLACRRRGRPAGRHVLAPTDPVLATDVQTRHAGDKDTAALHADLRGRHERRQRFPFVMLGLGMLGGGDDWAATTCAGCWST